MLIEEPTKLVLENRHSDDSTSCYLDTNDIVGRLNHEIKRRQSLERRNNIFCIALAVVVSVAFGAISVILQDQRRKSPNFYYSPAQHLVRYKTVAFESGFGRDKSAYSGYPNDENKKAWEDLYQYAIVKVPRLEAAKLVNHTAPLPADPNYSVVGIDVFHQLHCLDYLRNLAWGVDMGMDAQNEPEREQLNTRMDHCVNSIRQSLMCSADISTIQWNWVEKDQLYNPDLRTIHTCRDFEAIRDWAVENRAGFFSTIL
ncbi:hypothetical protein FE257_004231 [Aspergillus nanangensis]|uniref:Tat pathway signal sequence n=1 Tax=Aspergillus nanangensis TaxID=2582783 RepID=A0AAD4CRJ3_ASPNN|nr:hypothetical protein FE257_004231 [Aspergillus nanangensis]